MEKIIAIVSEVLEVEAEKVSEGYLFKKSDSWDSLAALSLITAIEDEFGVVINDDELANMQNVADIWKFVSAK